MDLFSRAGSQAATPPGARRIQNISVVRQVWFAGHAASIARSFIHKTVAITRRSKESRGHDP
jgi:hypothetical protein